LCITFKKTRATHSFKICVADEVENGCMQTVLCDFLFPGGAYETMGGSGPVADIGGRVGGGTGGWLPPPPADLGGDDVIGDKTDDVTETGSCCCCEVLEVDLTGDNC